MKHLRTNYIGVEQGSVLLFSDYEQGGEMWVGSGTRMRRSKVRFSEPFREAPSVQVGLTLWDFDCERNQRADLAAENVTRNGFDMVFRTWSDTRVARVRANWTAIGELKTADDWDVD